MKIKVFFKNNKEIQDLKNILSKFATIPRIDTPGQMNTFRGTNKNFFQEWEQNNLKEKPEYIIVHVEEESDVILLSEYLVGKAI